MVSTAAEPQPNHAVIMVRFANECMMKMNELTHELVGTLGEETGRRNGCEKVYIAFFGTSLSAYISMI
jgi:hypothetical protein